MMARWMLLLVLVLVGCSGQDPSLNGRPKVVVAMGTVLYKGAPLADASVIFTNLESATTAYAQTDSAGNFKLTTFNKGDGAAPGKQVVSVRKLEMLVKTKQGAENEISSVIPPMPEERWLIPKKFGNPELSGLGLELPDTGNPKIILDLKD